MVAGLRPVIMARTRFLAVQKAADDDARHVDGDQRQGEPGRCLVHLLDPLGAPEPVGGHQPAAAGREQDRRDQAEDHHRPSRVVAEIALRPTTHEAAQIAPETGRRRHEVLESGVGWADQAPDQPEGDQAEDDVTGDLVQSLAFLGQERRGEGRDQAPVKQAQERIPDPHRRLARGHRLSRPWS